MPLMRRPCGKRTKSSFAVSFLLPAARDTNCFWNSFLKAATGTLICWPGWSSAMSWACIPTTGRFCLRNGKRPGRVWKSSSCVTIPTAAAYSFSATTPRNRSCVRPLPIFPHDERVLGFAIGRSIFRAPAQRWFADEIGDDEAVQAMKEAFSRLIESWNHR